MTEPIRITPFGLAQRFVGMKEIHGVVDNPLVVAMLHLDHAWPEHDEVPWCSAFVNFICWLLRVPRSKSLVARSWLAIGTPIRVEFAEAGFDVVILRRGINSPGVDILDAPGHVGFFAGVEDETIHVLGGNQGDTVKVSAYRLDDVLGVRRLV